MAKILVVDDEPDIREVVGIVLETSGHEVMYAEDGKKGLSLVKKWQPDLIILDVMMPKMNGMQVLQLLRNMDEFDHIPVIMLTATTQYAREDDEHYKKKTGADDFISKPFNPADLVERVNNVLQNNFRRKSDGLIRYKIK